LALLLHGPWFSLERHAISLRLVSGDVNTGRRHTVTTAEQPPPDGDEQPPQATEDEDDSDVQPSESDDLKR